MKTEAVVAAAGRGTRLTPPMKARAWLRKPYLKIQNTPIIVLTLRRLASSKKIGGIIVVVNSRDRRRCLRLIEKYGVKKIKAVVEGGQTRIVSVRNGLKALDKDTEIALIHDGVRPFVDAAIIDRSIKCAEKFGACVVGVPIKATVKRVSTKLPITGVVEMTVPREGLWEIQTPQTFKRDLITKAYRKYGDTEASDDAMLVEKMGRGVRVIMGSYRNIKITTPEDLLIAKAIYLGGRRG